MKPTIGQLILLSAALILSSYSSADGGDVRHDSKVDGVSLFWLSLNHEETPNDVLMYGDAATIESHCDGSNRIFIYELGSKGFPCQSRDIGDRTNYDLRRSLVEILGMDAKDMAGAPHLYGDQGIYTVSKRPFPTNRWQSESLPTTLVMQLQELSRGKCLEKLDSCQWLTGTQLERQIDGIDVNFTPNDIERLAIRIKGTSKELLIVPVAVGAGAADAWAIRSSVFSKSGKSYDLVGRFWGSLIRLGADIDNDGIPELIIDNSTPGLSQEIYYYKIYPIVEYLISYIH